MSAADREIESLERQLEELEQSDGFDGQDIESERQSIIEAIRDIEREESDRSRWEEEGEERGWR
jgi:hypothetical protein